MKLTDPSVAFINEIGDNDVIWITRGGVDFKILGSDLKKLATSTETDISAVGVAVGMSTDIGLGQASTINTAVINYSIKRGLRRCSGVAIIVSNGVDCGLSLTGQLMLPNTTEETGGATLSAKIDSGQLFLTVTTDSLDADLTTFRGKVKLL